MKYYVSEKGVVYGLSDDSDPAEWIPEAVSQVDEISAISIANPPPTKEQLIELAEAEKQSRITEVHTETEILRAKLALGRIMGDEKTLLIAWLDYLDLLEAIDTSLAPDISWPVKPPPPLL